MVINKSICNSITFYFSGKNSAPQNLFLNGNPVKPVKILKLLGIILTDDLLWVANTDFLCKKVRKKFYFMCKLREFGATQDDLLLSWTHLFRPNTEYAAPLWHSGLTVKDSQRIESLQKQHLELLLEQFMKITRDIINSMVKQSPMKLYSNTLEYPR